MLKHETIRVTINVGTSDASPKEVVEAIQGTFPSYWITALNKITRFKGKIEVQIIPEESANSAAIVVSIIQEGKAIITTSESTSLNSLAEVIMVIHHCIDRISYDITAAGLVKMYDDLPDFLKPVKKFAILDQEVTEGVPHNRLDLSVGGHKVTITVDPSMPPAELHFGPYIFRINTVTDEQARRT